MGDSSARKQTGPYGYADIAEAKPLNLTKVVATAFLYIMVILGAGDVLRPKSKR